MCYGQRSGFCPSTEVEYRLIIGGSGDSNAVAVVVTVVVDMTATPVGLAGGYVICGLV